MASGKLTVVPDKAVDTVVGIVVDKAAGMVVGRTADLADRAWYSAD